MNFHIITLFPKMFESYLGDSILARAIKEKKIKVSFYNPRDFAKGKLRKKWPDGNVTTYVDDRPYGGGPGMVLRAEPILGAAEAVLKKLQAKTRKLKPKILIMSAGGKQFTNEMAEKLKKEKDIVIISGRYEGVDARVTKILKAEEISVGPYVLTGGEIAAMTIIDSVSRRVPGVLGKLESLEENRVSSSEIYTRPEVLEHNGKKYKVPKVLLSGHHTRRDEWKKRK